MTLRGIEIGDRAPVVAEPGPAPMLQWVRLDQLVIDDSYQRPLGPSNWKAIEKIAGNFLWSRFQPLLVAPVAGGRFAVIDGQHRAHAARLCGFAEVPAMAVQVELGEQARAFAWVNGQVIKVTRLQVYKAALAAGEDWAVRVNRAVQAAGCRLMTFQRSSAEKQVGELYCVSLVKKLVEAGMDEALTAGLAALRACPGMARPVCFSEYILRDWIPAVHGQPVRSVEVLAEALALRNPFKVIEDARSAVGAAAPQAVAALQRLIREAVDRRGVA